MINWNESMIQSFEYYIVDPLTWKDSSILNKIESCTINRDESNATLGSSYINMDEVLDENYIRVYLKIIQNGVSDKIPLGTFLFQTPSVSFDGKKNKVSMDGYTPLIELKESLPPIGYSLLKQTDIMKMAYQLCREHMRAPVVESKSNEKLYSDFVANVSDTWLTFVRDLVGNAKYKLYLDELGRLLFEPVQDVASLQPMWHYNDDNSSILYPSINDERDLYGVPNVVEVIYSSETHNMSSRIVNNDDTSPISVVNRGREIVYRESNPNITGEPTQEYLDTYATQLLRNLSCLEHTITYTHGYCPVRVGDCVLLNYKKAGLSNVKAKVTSQSIKCKTGCEVEETAIYTTKLWR